MSLQDDYFDLNAKLKGWQHAAFTRIWDAFVDMENEHEDLVKIRNAVRQMVMLTFPQETEVKQEEVNGTDTRTATDTGSESQ